MNKVLLMSLALMLVLSVSIVGCDGTPLPIVVVGMSRSLSGSCARLGQPFETIYPIYIDRLNAIDGIIIDGQPCKVELEVLNDGSDKDSLIENTDALIQDIADGGVHFLWGCTPCAEFIETQAI